MIRRWIAASAACGALLVPTKGQSQLNSTDVAVALPWIGYGVVSVAAITTLVRMPNSAPVELGRSARLRAGDGYFTGKVVSVESNRMVIIEANGAHYGVPVDSLNDVQISVGHKGWAQGWGIGFAAGAGAGAVLGFASGDDTEGDFFRFTAGQKALIAGVALGIAGSAVGTVIGLMAPERWVPATRPDGASRVSINPIIGSRVGLSAKIAF